MSHEKLALQEKSRNFVRGLEKAWTDVTHMTIHGNGKDKMSIFDPAKGADREGVFFVSLPDKVSEIFPGSVLAPVEFLDGIGDKHNDIEVVSKNLLSQETNKDQKSIFEFDNEKSLHLKVFNGSFNEHALNITEIAATGGFDKADVRAKYQGEVFEVVKGILSQELESDFTINEDCIASGETIGGLLTMLVDRTSAQPGKEVTINVNVATTQGILFLQKFVENNGIKLNINAGYLAYGLSEGVPMKGHPEVKMHANYITYPQEIIDMLPQEIQDRLNIARSGDGYIYVVGDMGDASKSLPNEYDEKYPWNKKRTDDRWGDKHTLVKTIERQFSNLRKTILYLPNGGFLQRCFRESLQDNIQQSIINILIMGAKRVWSPDKDAENGAYGYGVLIEAFDKNLLRDTN